ncbi:MAG: UDP-N-acetylmuramoyl-L-alanine--D-glutamate ligase [Armatimonadota bacterium]|jgi:UDP-N-acetylmuramoylalanine--D-glutamate ligase
MRLEPVRSIEEVEDYRASLRGRDVAVIGAGRSGLATMRRLAEAGARVRLADAQSRSELVSAAQEASGLGAVLVEEFERFEQIRGVDLVVSSPGIPWEHEALADARAAAVETFGTMEFAWRLCASPVIAVTGTNGKGTVCRMLSGMLTSAGIEHILAGNIGLPLADRLDATAPDVPAIVEVSSFQLETIVDFRPRVATLLNLAPDHLDRHPTFAAYAAAKARIFENQRPDDLAVINEDDEASRRLAEETAAQKLRVSLRTDGLDAGVFDGQFFVRSQGATEPVCAASDLPLPGRHHMTNALVAAVIARHVGAEVEAIAEGIRGYVPPRHHMELVAEVGGVQFINDSKASNPESATADLGAMQRPFVAIVGGKDKGADFSALAELLSDRARAVILIGEAADRIERMLSGGAVERADTLEAAVKRAYELSGPGWAVIMAPACSSFDMFRNYEFRGEAFRKAAAALKRD